MKLLKYTVLFALLFCFGESFAQQFDLTKEWEKKIEALAPDASEVNTHKSHKVLVFDLSTGFNHWVTPHTSQVIKIIGEKSRTYQVVISKDIYQFEKKELRKYDAIVLNNNCSKNPDRDLFLDVLEKDENLSEAQVQKKAAELEKNLIAFVKRGHGLMVVHGGITMQNNSLPFSQMVGGSFDYHPKQQQVEIKLVDPNHRLVEAFDGKSFTHTDEPYMFKNAYKDKNFRPLLYMETSKLKYNAKPFDEEIKYVSWIKPHGKGRVFFVSPSHNAQSFENPKLLKFYLAGMQYILGEIDCNDQAINVP